TVWSGGDGVFEGGAHGGAVTIHGLRRAAAGVNVNVNVIRVDARKTFKVPEASRIGPNTRSISESEQSLRYGKIRPYAFEENFWKRKTIVDAVPHIHIEFGQYQQAAGLNLDLLERECYGPSRREVSDSPEASTLRPSRQAAISFPRSIEQSGEAGTIMEVATSLLPGNCRELRLFDTAVMIATIISIDQAASTYGVARVSCAGPRPNMGRFAASKLLSARGASLIHLRMREPGWRMGQKIRYLTSRLGKCEFFELKNLEPLGRFQNETSILFDGSIGMR
ncbi:hypothetical protein BDK51DRAFT_28363, partial [Blyttiomyces helicus]